MLRRTSRPGVVHVLLDLGCALRCELHPIAQRKLVIVRPQHEQRVAGELEDVAARLGDELDDLGEVAVEEKGELFPAGALDVLVLREPLGQRREPAYVAEENDRLQRRDHRRLGRARHALGQVAHDQRGQVVEQGPVGGGERHHLGDRPAVACGPKSSRGSRGGRGGRGSRGSRGSRGNRRSGFRATHLGFWTEGAFVLVL
jgi:hypothetical protein